MNHTNSRAACKLLIHKHNLTDGPAGHIVEFVMRGGMTIQPSVAQVVLLLWTGPWHTRRPTLFSTTHPGTHSDFLATVRQTLHFPIRNVQVESDTEFPLALFFEPGNACAI